MSPSSSSPARTSPGQANSTAGTATVREPVPIAIRLRQPQRAGADDRFGPSDPPRGWDITANPRVARLVRDRRFQFLLIVPNQIIFWTVIFVGLLGTAIPGLNFGTAITWYLWFCMVFVLMVVVGRAWCAMCPFGGFAEWIQRRTFWRRTQKTLGLGRKFPEPLARYGFLLPVATFLLLTWIEEFFNIAGPGNPADTSFMVIGTVGSMGTAAGFRTRDRDVCLTCTTKDCMR